MCLLLLTNKTMKVVRRSIAKNGSSIAYSRSHHGATIEFQILYLLLQYYNCFLLAVYSLIISHNGRVVVRLVIIHLMLISASKSYNPIIKMYINTTIAFSYPPVSSLTLLILNPIIN
jgi:hypothetical protein